MTEEIFNELPGIVMKVIQSEKQKKRLKKIYKRTLIDLGHYNKGLIFVSSESKRGGIKTVIVIKYLQK